MRRRSLPVHFGGALASHRQMLSAEGLWHGKLFAQYLEHRMAACCPWRLNAEDRFPTNYLSSLKNIR